jgi:putative transposase
MRLEIGSKVDLPDGEYVVRRLDGISVSLWQVSTMKSVELHVDEISRITKSAVFQSRPEPGSLDAIDAKQEKSIAEMIQHIEEVTEGKPLPTRVAPSHLYDLATTTSDERIRNKSIELKERGQAVSQSTLRRKISLYRKFGSAGLIDKRTTKAHLPMQHVDPKITEVVAAVLKAEQRKSNGTRERFAKRIEDEMDKRYPGTGAQIPSPKTLSRYASVLGHGQYTFGKSQNRRSASLAPTSVFKSRPAFLPGQETQVDTSLLEVFVRDEHGDAKRPYMAKLMDKATHSVLAIALSFDGMKGIDLAVLLARALRPPRFREGAHNPMGSEFPLLPWAENLSPEDLKVFDGRRPFIVPERIMTDNGSDYRSDVFASMCARHEISLTHSSVLTPTNKAMIERSFEAFKNYFTQYLPGYCGGDVSVRGVDPASDPDLLDIYTLASLIDEFVAVVWQNLPTSALRDPVHPIITHSPNTMYAAMFPLMGFVDTPLDEDEYVSILPKVSRQITRAGVNLYYRRYDSPELDRYRTLANPDGTGFKWDFRYDPYDPSSIWMFDPREKKWIRCEWVHKDRLDVPFAAWTRRETRAIKAHAPELVQTVGVDNVLQIIASTTKARKREAKENARNETARKQLEQSGLPVAPELEGVARGAESALDHFTEFDEVGTFDPTERH